MGLEIGTYISDLNPNNPVTQEDIVREGSDHLRLIKSTILNSFPAITGAMTLTHEQINAAAIKNEANEFTALQQFKLGAEIEDGGVYYAVVHLNSVEFVAKADTTYVDAADAVLQSNIDTLETNTNAALDTKYDSSDLASQAQAEARTDNTTLMTPLRTGQAVESMGLRRDGDVTVLTWNAFDVAQTQQNNASGKASGLGIKDAWGGYRDAGFNDNKSAYENQNVTLDNFSAGRHLYFSGTANYTVTCPDSGNTSFPTHSRVEIINRGSGTITLSAAAGASLFNFNGSGSPVGVSSLSVAPGGWCTLHRRQSTVWLVTGSGVS